MLQRPAWDKAVELGTQKQKLPQFLFIMGDTRTQTPKASRG